MDDLTTWWTASGASLVFWNLLRGVVLLLIGWKLALLAQASTDRAMPRASEDASLRLLVGRVVFLIVAGLGILTALDTVGVPISSVITTLGIVGIAVSLAMQDLLKNFFAGLYLLFERPFRIGDEIQLKDFRGKVEHVDYRTTILRTTENVQVYVPNATLISEIVLNRGKHPVEPASTLPVASPAAQTSSLTGSTNDPDTPRAT